MILCTKGDWKDFCFKLLRIQTQGCSECLMIRKSVTNSNIYIPRSTIQPKLKKFGFSSVLGHFWWFFLMISPFYSILAGWSIWKCIFSNFSPHDWGPQKFFNAKFFKYFWKNVKNGFTGTWQTSKETKSWILVSIAQNLWKWWTDLTCMGHNGPYSCEIGLI